MIIKRGHMALTLGCAALLAGCSAPAPPPMVVPAAFTPLGTSAPYLLGDVIGGTRPRAAKMRAAKIRPLNPMEVGPYMSELDSELRRHDIAHVFHRYPDVGHGFQNPARETPEERHAAADSWAKTLAFLRKVLPA